ncbi:MAG: GtrA family protein [Chloroflexota bacterium]
MIIIYNERERIRFLKFMVVGIIGFVVDFFSFNLFRTGLGFEANFSSILSFLVAVISNFYLNRYWTYPDSRTKNIKAQVMQFLGVSVVGLVIRTWIFVLVQDPFVMLFRDIPSIGNIPPAVIGENAALAFVVIIVMFWNFFANRFWTYNDID